MAYLPQRISNWRGELLMMGSLCVLFLCVAGCSHDAPLKAVPAQWNPSYHPCLATAFEQPRVMNEAYYRLGFRAGTLEYWRLCKKLVDEATDSDYVIIVEQLPEEDHSQYWYVLVMARADQVTVYTGGSRPFRKIDIGKPTDGPYITRVPEESDHIRSVGARKFEEVLQVMEECRVWDQGNQVFSFPKDVSPVIGGAPVMIHVFRRSDERRVEFLLADPVLTPSAIEKCCPMNALKDASLAWFGAPRTILEEAGPARLAERERLFHRSLPARCVLNNALMLLASSTK